MRWNFNIWFPCTWLDLNFFFFKLRYNLHSVKWTNLRWSTQWICTYLHVSDHHSYQGIDHSWDSRGSSNPVLISISCQRHPEFSPLSASVSFAPHWTSCSWNHALYALCIAAFAVWGFTYIDSFLSFLLLCGLIFCFNLQTIQDFSTSYMLDLIITPW